MNPVKCRVTTVTNTEDSVMLGTYDAIPNTSAVMDIIWWKYSRASNITVRQQLFPSCTQ
jgi:hypothetical protein